MEGQSTYQCKCGAAIQYEDVDYSNGCNDEGEDYYNFSFTCPNCGYGLESSQWGEAEDTEEVLSEIEQQYPDIKEIK